MPVHFPFWKVTKRHSVILEPENDLHIDIGESFLEDISELNIKRKSSLRLILNSFSSPRKLSKPSRAPNPSPQNAGKTRRTWGYSRLPGKGHAGSYYAPMIPTTPSLTLSPSLPFLDASIFQSCLGIPDDGIRDLENDLEVEALSSPSSSPDLIAEDKQSVYTIESVIDPMPIIQTMLLNSSPKRLYDITVTKSSPKSCEEYRVWWIKV